MTKYYKTDSRNLTLAEYWRITGTFRAFLTAAFNKLLGVQIKLTGGIPEPGTFGERIRQKEDLPAELTPYLESVAAECAALGFGNICYYDIKEKLTGGKSAGVHLLHEAGEIMATIVSVKFGSRGRNVVAFTSILRDGSVLGTCDQIAQFNEPSGWRIDRMKGRPLLDLWRRQQGNVEKIRKNNPPKKFSGLEAYEANFESVTRRMFRNNVDRRVWVEMSADEVVALQGKLSP